MVIKKALCLVVFCFAIVSSLYAQTDQIKAEELVKQYLSHQTKNTIIDPSIKFSPVKVLRSSFENTKLYKNLLHKVDSLKIEGKRIDARIAKMKTTAELNQAKKDSYRLSKELVNASDNLIDFITSYKGQQIGWLLKASYPIKSRPGLHSSKRKTFYLNKQLTQVDSVR